MAGVLAVACSEVLGPQQDDLSSARSRWAQAGPSSYVYELQRICFCGPDFIRAVRIQVMGGVVTSAVYVDTEEPVPGPLGEVDRIEDLLDEIQDAIDAEAFSLEATYDPILGYPVDVSIDFNEMIVDEEMTFRVRNFGEILF